MAETEGASPRFLLVEGADELHVIRAICQRMPDPPEFSIEIAGGIDALLQRIDLDIDAPGREIAGFVLDGNDEPQRRWQAICHRLRQADVDDPSTPDPNGTIIRRDDAADVGIWMMPNNGSPGELEDFLAAMIPETDRLWELSQNFVQAIPASELRFPKGKLLRAQIHVWLSLQEQPRRSGQAIVANELDLTGGIARRFQSWLVELFTPISP